MYCLSPDYAKPIVKESSPYTFVTKMYTDPVMAHDNLIYTNMDDIVGFVISYFELPLDLSDLASYINFLSRVAKGKTVVLTLDLLDGIDELKDNCNLKDLNFFVVHVKDAFTDYVIKRDVFGTILREVYSPYLENRPTEVIEYRKNFLEYEPLLSYDMQMVFEEIPRVDSVDRAFELDEILPKLEDIPIALALRKFRISKRWGIDTYDETRTLLNTLGANQLQRSSLELINKGVV